MKRTILAAALLALAGSAAPARAEGCDDEAGEKKNDGFARSVRPCA